MSDWSFSIPGRLYYKCGDRYDFWVAIQTFATPINQGRSLSQCKLCITHRKFSLLSLYRDWRERIFRISLQALWKLGSKFIVNRYDIKVAPFSSTIILFTGAEEVAFPFFLYIHTSLLDFLIFLMTKVLTVETTYNRRLVVLSKAEAVHHPLYFGLSPNL